MIDDKKQQCVIAEKIHKRKENLWDLLFLEKKEVIKKNQIEEILSELEKIDKKLGELLLDKGYI
jgi:hypothetical protein